MFAVIQDERFAIQFRDFFQRPPQNGLLLAADGLFGWQGLDCRRVVGIFQRRGVECRLASVAFEAFLNQMAGDAAQPGAELGRFAQGAELFPRGKKGFLGHVLAPAHVAGGAVGQGADQGLMRVLPTL